MMTVGHCQAEVWHGGEEQADSVPSKNSMEKPG